MTLEQALKQAAESAARIESAVADAKGGYADVLRQVMQCSTDISALRVEVRDNEKLAANRHIELLEALKGANRG